MAVISDRFKRAWNAFRGNDRVYHQSYYYGSYSHRPDRTWMRIQNARTIISTIYNRIAVDCSLMDVKHVQLDDDGNYKDVIKDNLNRLFTKSANIDQTGREFILDAVMSMIDEGCVALVPFLTTKNPEETDSYEVLSARVGKIKEWFAKQVLVEVYNQDTMQKEDLLVSKKYTPIIENPFYSIMNSSNSTLKRLIRVLNQLDRTNSLNSSGKLDIIIQLPYTVKNETKYHQAEERRRNIEAQISGSQLGIAYIDGTERVIQLNRPAENNLWSQAKELQDDLFNQMGLTKSIFDGTADEQTMINYYNRTIEPIMLALVEEMERKWISLTAQTQGQAIRFFRDPFKLAPLAQIAEVSDSFTRNEIFSSNEIRTTMGWKPSKDPRADQLINSNLKTGNSEVEETSTIESDLKIPNISKDILDMKIS